jgi:hypothetical protein
MRLLVFSALLLACATTADARTFLLGAVTLGPGEIARLHVVNAEGGDVTVVLAFQGTTPAILATTGEAVLAPGDVKILDIKGSDVPGGIVVPSVAAIKAEFPSACRPLVTLQVIDTPRQPRAAPFASVQVAARGLGSGERAAVDMLRTLAKAQSLFFDATRLSGGNPAQVGAPHYAASLGELAQAGLVPPNTTVSGYELGFVVGLYTFQITAKPVAGVNGHVARTFYVDEAGVIGSGGLGAPCDDDRPAPTTPIGG